MGFDGSGSVWCGAFGVSGDEVLAKVVDVSFRAG